MSFILAGRGRESCFGCAIKPQKKGLKEDECAQKHLRRAESRKTEEELVRKEGGDKDNEEG